MAAAVNPTQDADLALYKTLVGRRPTSLRPVINSTTAISLDVTFEFVQLRGLVMLILFYLVKFKLFY